LCVLKEKGVKGHLCPPTFKSEGVRASAAPTPLSYALDLKLLYHDDFWL
jgi:hypothetical protein